MSGRTQEAPLCRRSNGRDISDRDLQQLIELDLSDSSLSSLAILISDHIVRPMLKLLKLNLSRQATSTSIPDEIDRLWPNLTHLNLSRNSISHVLDALGRLTKLQVLDLGDNKLKQFPKCILRLKCSLTTLVLSGNKIHRLPPEICTLKKLRVLRLANNRLKDLPVELCFLKELDTLSLQNNEIVYLPRDLFKLNVLYLQIPTGAGALDDSGDTIGLTVKGNPLEYPPLSICQKGVRRMLDYMQNNLPEMSPNVLYIRNRGLSSWPSSPALEQVTAIYAEDNLIGCLPSNLRELFPNVRALHLDGNNIQTFPSGLFNLRLERLSLVKQQGMSPLTVLPPEIGMLVYLQELDLSCNAIEKIPADIRHLQLLRVLDLQKNKLQNLPDEICELRCLECLILRRNNILELPSNIGFLEQLLVLQLSKNRLTKLPDAICCLRKVAVLTLRSNRLVCLPQDLDNLEGLSSPEPFFYATMHTTFNARELKLEDNPALMFPPLSECSNVFDYLRRMRQLPRIREEALRRVPNSQPQRCFEYRVLTLEFRVFLARKLATELYQMCCLLGMDSDVWNEIQVDYGREGVVRQGCEMMQRWLVKDGGPAREPELVNRLRTALQGVDRNDLVYELNVCVSEAGINGC